MVSDMRGEEEEELNKMGQQKKIITRDEGGDCLTVTRRAMIDLLCAHDFTFSLSIWNIQEISRRCECLASRSQVPL
jgi:hypothetical protein